MTRATGGIEGRAGPAVPPREARHGPEGRVVRVAGADAGRLRAAVDGVCDELGLPGSFPPEVERAARDAAARAVADGRPDRTDLHLVTVDPPGSRDLDQALHIARSGDGFVVHYAVADVAAFVGPGDPVDEEAHARGETLYGGVRSIPLHPRVLSEGAGSLLPGVDRPAILWRLDLDGQGALAATHVARATVRSRDRLDYERAQAVVDEGATHPAGLHLLGRVGALLRAREVARGGVSLPMPEQVVERDGGRWRLAFRRMLDVERWNAQISLLTGMAGARLMLDGGIGVLRTLPAADPAEPRRLRRTARALGIAWPDEVGYPDMVHALDPARPADAAMLAASARLLRGSGYTAFDGAAPEDAEHAGLAAHYAHVTAPLRRLVDRYALEVCVALCAGEPVPDWVRARLPGLPGTMRSSARRAGAFEGAVLNLVEAVVLEPHLGERFRGVVVERDPRRPERGAVVIADPAIEARVDGDAPLPVGSAQEVVLTEADPATRRVRFAWPGATDQPPHA
jgi:exoribonuclease R